jgi:hypothetical protein
VHLAGETHAHDAIGGDAALRQDGGHGLSTGAPPIVGILLRPAGLRRMERGVIGRRRSQPPAVVVDEQRARTARTDVEA